ncbi:hypothetical protein [Streptomyces melanogenes]|uniref:hypothetical protein n=1 Tax=Streptomyces melanogenes TaxID=67326 RepID=UPI0037931902
MQKYPSPPRAAENAELVTRRLRAALEDGGTPETVTVEWNGKPLHVGVVDMPLTGLYYNPATHRIRAQRGHDPRLAATLASDPWCSESQDYLFRLLVGKPSNPDEIDPEFEHLRESLARVGQQEPGLLTRDGILVNGNTRAAALRMIGRKSIRVGVLPDTFTWDDINDVELSLQLRPDKRREYSYINRLLAMEEQELMGRAPEDIAKSFHVQVKTFRQERWILSVIEEMIERSSLGDGSRLRLVDFEGHKENLKELHRAYTKAAASSQSKADQIKENRIAAIILDFPKTSTRLIGDEFHDTYLDKSLPSRLKEGGGQAAPVGIAGLSVSLAAPSECLLRARGVTDVILKAKAQETSETAPEAVRVEARAKVIEARKGMLRALTRAERDDKLRKVQQTASERIDDATAAINQSVSDLVQARASGSLDEEAFDNALQRLRQSLEKLARQAVRGAAEPGDGMQWLTRAVTGR